MKRLLMLLTLLSMMTVLFACGETEAMKKTESKEVVESEEVVVEVEEELESEYIETGGIRVGKDGAIKRGEDLTASVVVDFFFDPICLSCSMYNDMMGILIENKIMEGEIEVVFHPVPYLNDQTPDDYSNRASAYILAVAEYAPERALPFIQQIISEDFTPKSPNEESTPDSKFIEAMEKAGLSDDEIDKVEFNKASFVSIAIAAGKEFSSEDSHWKEYSPIKDDDGNKVAFTPFVLINENGLYDNEALALEGDLVKEFDDMVKKANGD